MKKYGFGVDIGGTTCKIGLFETTGTMIEKWEIPTRTENNGINILPDVAASVEAKMTERGIKKDEVQGMGIGVPGPVNADGVVQRCVNLGWDIFNVAKDMQERTGFLVKVGNDANVAALGEMWQGGGKGHKDIVMVTLGTGVGGGIIIGGKMVSGSKGAGGEIGHMNVNEEETATCGCGKHGCLEQYASATGIVRLAKLRLEENADETMLRTYNPLTAKDVFDAAKAKDAVAEEVVEKMAKILGRALANIACVVNPEIFVIGGGVSKAGTIITDRVKKYFEESAFHTCLHAEFALATLGNDAGMYGCVQMILE
ncbi:MAG: ROK family glucokinase [Lachnospiraceae bacterium]|nr:ROK family glucokinase [Lachnospiraceae bacterium]